MKKSIRLVTAALALCLALSVCVGAFAASRIEVPKYASRMNLPEVPDYITLETWTDSVALGDPCPIVAISDATVHVTFSEKPDKAQIVWYEGTENLDVDENGYAEASSTDRKMQHGLRTGKITFKSWKDNIAVVYHRDGTPESVTMTVDGDYLGLGLDNPKTTITYTPVTVKAPKLRSKKADVWYVSKVVASYQDGEDTLEITAYYLNTKGGKLQKYVVRRKLPNGGVQRQTYYAKD